MDNSKIIAVLNIVGEDLDTRKLEVKNNSTIVVDGCEYLVYTNDEADDAFSDYQEDLWKDFGFTSFSDWAQDYILDNFIDEDWFNDNMQEYFESKVADMSEEELKTEMEREGVRTEESLVQSYYDLEDSGISWYRHNFGDADFTSAVDNNCLIDLCDLTNWVRNTDGRGCLAPANGIEEEWEDYYIYKIS